MVRDEPLPSNQCGVIITTKFTAGFEGQPGLADPSAAKGGIVGMPPSIAWDLAEKGHN